MRTSGRPEPREQREALARRLGWPILADPLSGLRCGVHDRSLVVDAYDVFLRSEEWAHSHEPEVVIRFGASPVSKVLVQFLSQNEATRLTVVDAGGEWLDPMLGASEMLHVDPVALCDALTEEIAGDDAPPGEWAATWVEANELTREALSEGLAELEELFEGRVCADLADALPDGSLLYVGNSMPVRDVDSFVRSSGKRIRLLGNRGASGIDGVVSSALGASAAGEGPAVLVIGDVSFYHDMNGLLASRLYGLELTVVLLNNDGGGIFSFLPQATRTRHFEELFGAPHGLDFSQGAAMYGAEYTLIQEHTELAPALQAAMGSGGLTVLEVCTDRARNVELHRALTDRAVRAVATAVRVKAVEAL
ncbi:MAG: thiamine pyrophosphate-dependent enzyme [Chloroflexia bacterium]